MRGLQFKHSYAIEFDNPIELYANRENSGFDFHKCDKNNSELS
jgi:hypothetical protein